MDKFKKTYFTSEFGTTAALLLGLAVVPFYLPSLDAWSIAVTWCVSCYIGARGIFKKDRAVYLYDGYKTSEFKVFTVGVLMIAAAIGFKKMNLNYGLLEIVFMHSVFNLARGYTKSLKVSEHRTTMMR